MRIPHPPVLALVTRVRAFVEQQRQGGRPPGEPGKDADF
jgi:hypothetical protein